MDFNPIYSHILVNTKFRIQKAGRLGPAFDTKYSAAKSDEPKDESDEDSRNGKEKADANPYYPALVHNGKLTNT